EDPDAFAVVEMNRPDGPLELCVDDSRQRAGNRTGYDVLAVGRHDRVVDAAEHANELDLLELLRVDDVNAAVVPRDRRVYPLPVLSHRNVVWWSGQRNALDDLQRRRVDDVQRRK